MVSIGRIFDPIRSKQHRPIAPSPHPPAPLHPGTPAPRAGMDMARVGLLLCKNFPNINQNTGSNVTAIIKSVYKAMKKQINKLHKLHPNIIDWLCGLE